MLAELSSDKFSELIPLYHKTDGVFPLILAVLEHSQRGQVFMADPASREAAFVVNKFGFARLLGTGDGAFDNELMKLFADNGRLAGGYLLWYDPPPRWQERLDPLVGDSVKRRERARFEFRSERGGYISEAPQCPEGFVLREMDHDLLPKVKKFGLDLESRFWSSADEFVAKALGVCVVEDDVVVSLCYAAAVADGLAEVDVATDPEFRGRGLATMVAQEFVRKCLAHGVAPTWDCFVYNASSMKLADKLGFDELYRYPFYSFNVPSGALQDSAT